MLVLSEAVRSLLDIRLEALGRALAIKESLRETEEHDLEEVELGTRSAMIRHLAVAFASMPIWFVRREMAYADELATLLSAAHQEEPITEVRELIGHVLHSVLQLKDRSRSAALRFYRAEDSGHRAYVVTATYPGQEGPEVRFAEDLPAPLKETLGLR